MRLSRNVTPRAVRPLLVGLLIAGLAMSWLPKANAFDGPPLEVKGFANGQLLYAGALTFGGTTNIKSDVAWTSSNVDADADGLKAGKLNEMKEAFQPGLKNKHTYAFGSPVNVNDEGLKSEASAPPRSKDQDEVGSVDADPAAFASGLRSTTVANWNESPLVPGVCVLGDDLARGQASVADAELVDADGSAGGGESLELPVLKIGAAQNTSRERLVPTGTPNVYGLMSEVREIPAPVSVLATDDTGEQSVLRIELLGTWVLRAVATGFQGGATIHYGPGEASPETPLLRILQDGTVIGELKTQDLFGPGLLPIPLIDIPGLVTVTIGENPRAIAAPGAIPDPDSKPTTAADGTLASAAVDVVRIKLLSQPDPEAADLRVGHMEVSAQVPEGGIKCPIPVEKGVNPDKIQINGSPDTARYKITVHNVYDCDLVDVLLTDVIRQKEGDPDFQLIAAEPTAESPDMPTGNLTEADVVWKLGTIAKGESKSVTLDLKSATKGGIIRDIATAEGVFKNCVSSAEAGLDVANLTVSGSSPEVLVAIETPRTGPAAASTTAVGSTLALGAMAASWLIRRRRR